MKYRLILIALLFVLVGACDGGLVGRGFPTLTPRPTISGADYAKATPRTLKPPTYAVTSEVRCYTTSNSDNGEYVEVYPKGAIVIGAGPKRNGYTQIKATSWHPACWINSLALTVLK